MSTSFAPLVVVDSWASRSVARNAALVLGLTAFTSLCAQIAIPLGFTPVPLTLQTFAVLAGAAALGSQRAVIAQVLYLLVGMAGVPVFAEHSSGTTAVVGATGGYLVGFVVASYVVGAIAERGATRKVASTVLAYVVGTAVIYILGATWLSHVTGMSASDTLANGVTPFLAGDAIKAVLAGGTLPVLWKIADS